MCWPPGTPTEATGLNRTLGTQVSSLWDFLPFHVFPILENGTTNHLLVQAYSPTFPLSIFSLTPNLSSVSSKYVSDSFMASPASLLLEQAAIL